MSGKKYNQFFKQQSGDGTDKARKGDDDKLHELLDAVMENLDGIQGFAVPSSAVDEVMKLLPEDLPDGLRDAFLLSKQIGESDAILTQAAQTARRLEMMSNGVMMEVGERYSITPQNSPEGTYATRIITAASIEELRGYVQALSQAYDQAMLAFTESYRIVHTLMTHPAVTVRIGAGELKTVPNAEHERLLTLQSERDRVRSIHIAAGITHLEQMVKQGKLDEQGLGAAVGTLFKEANALALQVELRDDEEEGHDGDEG